MKIAVVAANGKTGKKIVAEALSRNLDVTAIIRGENKSVAKKVIVKDILSLTKEDLKNFDVVIDCFGAWKEEDELTLDEVKRMLCERFDLIDYEMAKEDVKDFIKDKASLDIWSSNFFKAITQALKDA